MKQRHKKQGKRSAARDVADRGTRRKAEHDATNKADRRSWLSTRSALLIGLGLVVAIVGLLLAKAAWERSAVSRWEANRAVLSFVKVDAMPQLPPSGYGDHETWFFFKNREGGYPAKAMHADDAELLLISPDRRTCIVGLIPDLSIPGDIGPGQIWNMRLGIPTAEIRESRMTAEFRASFNYIEGTDYNNEERSATMPFCRKLSYDTVSGDVRWSDCVGEPPPNCTKVMGAP